MTTLTCGTFDMLHSGHINMLKRCAGISTTNNTIVGVSSDFLNIEKKNRLPVMSIYERYILLKSLKYVSKVFIENEYTSDSKIEYMKHFNAKKFVIGDDWINKFDDIKKGGFDVVYLSRTPKISTTAILDKLSYTDTFDYRKSMIPLPSATLLSAQKINNVKCVLFCREQPHQAVHLLPYYYLFKAENVAWYIERKYDDSQINTNINDVIDNIQKYTGITLNNILYSQNDIIKFNPQLGIITEMWDTYCQLLHKIGAKMFFIDHGICVGTRPPNWFAMKAQNGADKILVAGNMQKQYHKVCKIKYESECHSKNDNDICIIGWPRFDLVNDTQWIWDLYGTDYDKKILYCPTSHYSAISYPTNEIKRITINLFRNLCKKHKVVIRPHPIDSSLNFALFHDLIETSIAESFSHNLVIIPSHSNIYTLNLFKYCDIAILDKSSVGYEYLLFDKPAIVIGQYTWDVPDTLFLRDAFPHYSLNEINLAIIEENAKDSDKLKNMRNMVKKYVFAYTDSSWIDNFKKLLQ